MIAYRICERKDNKLYTLFHGINGSRHMPLNEWLTANVKQVSDGSRKTSTVYTSGFHVLPTLKEIREFSSRFTAKRDLVIVECEVGNNYWSKLHSQSNVLLSDTIKLTRIIETIQQ